MNDILEHYNQVREADRLFTGPGELERVRTQEVIGRFFPPPPATVLDIGGGPGVYAGWLLGLGYTVHLIDPVPAHVEQASRRMAAMGVHSGEARIGDARELDFGDASQDAVLMLGPLYHLTAGADRMRALAEAHRVLKPDGVLVAAAISRFASLLDGFSRSLVTDPMFREILSRDLEDGQHRNFTADPTYFTTAYFHRPDELAGEIRDAGYRVEQLVAVEGPFWCQPGFEKLWASAPMRAYMLEKLRQIEAEPSLMAASAHILVVARPGRSASSAPSSAEAVRGFGPRP